MCVSRQLRVFTATFTVGPTTPLHPQTLKADINESVILEVVDAIVSSGLAAAGYSFVNLVRACSSALERLCARCARASPHRARAVPIRMTAGRRHAPPRACCSPTPLYGPMA